MTASFSLEQRVGQLFFIGVPGPALDPPTRDLLREISPGGVCLFARNIREREQTRSLLDEIRNLLPCAPIVSIDQEGGVVDRLRRIMTPMPAANLIESPEDAQKLGEIISEALSILGFNMDFAPVVDIIDEGRSHFSNGLRSRNFGRSAEQTTELAAAFLGGLDKFGICNCLKHFPGLGAADVDSHEELPVIDLTDIDLQKTDLYPYEQLLTHRRIDAVMVAHACFPGLSLQECDQNGKLIPTSLSKNFISALLCEQLAYDGLVITDDLEMGAILSNYGIADACKMAFAAGADMLTICADPDRIIAGHKAVVEGFDRGELDVKQLDRSLERIDAVRRRCLAPADFENARLDELSSEIEMLKNKLAR